MNFEPLATLKLPGFGTPQDTDTQELLVEFVIPGRVPSWNDILGMETWQRYKYKKELANAFLYELRRIANDCSTETTCASSTWSTYADTLQCYLETAQLRRKLKLARKKLEKESPNLFESKSSKSDSVPF